ncbi:hypothetical protein [Paenibacillus turpanensis]|uniref:hypothetical protein n=1 Tax=Paenibacillus turpanensis TaxID=2689078 RepID=UPI00140AE56A|nr:hypothetical protein [Paenibacillus turpanensis]
MASIEIVDPRTIRIHAGIEDALTMVRKAAENILKYAEEIVKIFDMMPEFEYTYFCFYAYDTAVLFEEMLGVDPKQYFSFSMNAPDAFFYTLYGGMGGLYEQAKRFLS